MLPLKTPPTLDLFFDAAPHLDYFSPIFSVKVKKGTPKRGREEKRQKMSWQTGPLPLQPHFVRGPPPPLPWMSSEAQKRGELAREVRGSKDKTNGCERDALSWHFLSRPLPGVPLLTFTDLSSSALKRHLLKRHLTLSEKKIQQEGKRPIKAFKQTAHYLVNLFLANLWGFLGFPLFSEQWQCFHTLRQTCWKDRSRQENQEKKKQKSSLALRIFSGYLLPSTLQGKNNLAR